jgi:hypothetical protein
MNCELLDFVTSNQQHGMLIADALLVDYHLAATGGHCIFRLPSTQQCGCEH